MQCYVICSILSFIYNFCFHLLRTHSKGKGTFLGPVRRTSISEVIGLAHLQVFPLSSVTELPFNSGIYRRNVFIKAPTGCGTIPGFVEDLNPPEPSELQEGSTRVNTKYNHLPTARKKLCVCSFSNRS